MSDFATAGHSERSHLWGAKFVKESDQVAFRPTRELRIRSNRSRHVCRGSLGSGKKFVCGDAEASREADDKIERGQCLTALEPRDVLMSHA